MKYNTRQFERTLRPEPFSRGDKFRDIRDKLEQRDASLLALVTPVSPSVLVAPEAPYDEDVVRVVIRQTVDAEGIDQDHVIVWRAVDAQWPPKPGSYQWMGAPFKAYMPVGFRAADYETFAYEDDSPPTLAHTFFTVERRHGFWIISQPEPSSVEFVVLSWVSVRVLGVNPITIDPGTFAVSISDDERTVLPWPGYAPRIYNPLLKSRFTPSESAPVLGMVNVGGLLFVSLDLKWDLQSLDGSVEVSQCPV